MKLFLFHSLIYTSLTRLFLERWKWGKYAHVHYSILVIHDKKLCQEWYLIWNWAMLENLSILYFNPLYCSLIILSLGVKIIQVPTSILPWPQWQRLIQFFWITTLQEWTFLLLSCTPSLYTEKEKDLEERRWIRTSFQSYSNAVRLTVTDLADPEGFIN